ncbi:hypothetical protein Tco_0008067 [Tanacetum coccineum]
MKEDKESDEVEEVSEDDEDELKKHLVIKKDEDIAIDAIPLATKLPDATRNRQRRLEGSLEDGDLKVMFEPDKRSDVWRILQDTRRNLKIQKMNIKFRGGLLGLKRLHGFLEVTAAQGRSTEDIDDNVDVSLFDETQERQDDDLMFDTGVLEDDEIHVDAKVDGKDNRLCGLNKPELRLMRIDDLYNNLKIIEQKVKKSIGISSGAQNLAFMNAPSTSNTNNANTASLQDLEKIQEDDLEAMDLKWQLSLLSVRAKKGMCLTVISWDTLPGSVEHQESKEGQFSESDKHMEEGNN